MAAKEIDRKSPHGAPTLHTIMDRSPDKPLADIYFLISSEKQYDSRQKYLAKALQRHGIANSIVKLADIETLSGSFGSGYRPDAIKIELPPFMTKERQIERVRETLHGLLEVGEQIKTKEDRWDGITVKALVSEKNIDSIVETIEKAYREEDRTTATDPSRFTGKSASPYIG